MDEELSETSGLEFEYMLRDQKAFLERLLEYGVSDEARKEIEARLSVIVSTLA